MQIVDVEVVHQLLCPRTVGERTAVVVSHHVAQLVEHDFAGVGVIVVCKPGVLIGSEYNASTQSDNTVTRVYQSYLQGTFSTHPEYTNPTCRVRSLRI